MSQCGPDCNCGANKQSNISDEKLNKILKNDDTTLQPKNLKEPTPLPPLEMSEEEIKKIRPNRAYRRLHKKCKCKGLGLVRVKNKLEVCFNEI